MVGRCENAHSGAAKADETHDIRTTMNIFGDVETDEMSTASLKLAELAFHGNGAHDRAQPR
jgi:hypothetical protein